MKRAVWVLILAAGGCAGSPERPASAPEKLLILHDMGHEYADPANIAGSISKRCPWTGSPSMFGKKAG